MNVPSAALATLFLVAAFGKLRGDNSLADYVVAVGVRLGLRQRAALDRAVPPVEIALAVWLLTGLAPAAAAIAALVLTSGFVIVHAAAVISGVPVSCRCFGRADVDMPAALTLVRALGILALAVLSLALSLRAGAAHGGVTPSVAVAGVLTGLGFHLTFLVWHEVNQMLTRDRVMRAAVADAARRHSEGSTIDVA